MTARKVLMLVIVVLVATGLGLSSSIWRQKAGPKPKKEAPAAARRPLPAKRTQLAKKIQPIENKIITGIFDRNMIDGRTKFERAIGRDIAVVSIYQSWGDGGAFPGDMVVELGEVNKVLMVTWEPWQASETDWDQPKYRLSKIAAGNHDAYIKKWLLSARAARQPILVRFAHEMNGDWYPWGKHVNAPADYIAAWRHIVDMSRELGATNITWVWSPNEVNEEDNLDVYYPGDNYVDWIGVSGFNWGGLERWQAWRSYRQIFGRTFEQIRKYSKPIAITEIAAIENPRAGQQSRAAWIAETLAQVKSSDPKVSMFIWFDATFEANGKLYNWVIDGSPASVEAMKDGLSDPAFSGDISN